MLPLSLLLPSLLPILRLYHPYIKGFFYRSVIGGFNTHGNYFAGFQRVDDTIYPKPCGGVVWGGLGVVPVCYLFQQFNDKGVLTTEFFLDDAKFLGGEEGTAAQNKNERILQA